VTEVTFLLQVTDSVTFALLYSSENRNKTMLPAIDSFGKSILPTKGAKGFCPGCGGKMVARCGSIVRHHWAHAKGKDCDTWSDSVGPWHLAWQNCFPRECQEIWMGENNEHRADIKGEHQILEIQKSSISATEIAERESFYGNMSWMLCGEDFEHRFKLHAMPGSKGLLFEFRWYRWKKSWVGAEKTIYIHFRKGIAKLLEFNDDGTGVVEFVGIDHIKRAFDSSFNPSPIQQAGKGFEPLHEGFVEKCIEAKQDLDRQALEREGDLKFYEIMKDGILYLKEAVWDVLCNDSWADNPDVKRLFDYVLPYVGLDYIEWFSSEPLNEIFLRETPFVLDRTMKYRSACHDDFLLRVSQWRGFVSLHSEFERNLGKSILDIRSEIEDRRLEETRKEEERKAVRMLCFRAKTQPIVLGKFIDHFLALLAPEIESYSLLARFDKNFPVAGWANPAHCIPQREELKAFLVFLPEKLKSEIIERVKFRSEKHLQDQTLEQERQEAARIQSEEAAKRSLAERLEWPLDEHAGHLARAFDGEDMGSTSLAMHVAMFPDSIWANEASDEQLMVAGERLKGFNPVGVWK
jgi:predicted RNA-binding Zn-ribbon protein involved in translation (DUF1610 family)